MDSNRTVSLTISLPKNYRDVLRRKSAEWNLSHLDNGISAARIARDIICEYLDGVETEVQEEIK